MLSRPSATYFVALLLWVATLVPIWTLKFFPGQDTPNHLYAVHARNRLEQAPFSTYLKAETRARTNLSFHVLMKWVEGPIDLNTAHRVFLSLYLLFFLAGALYLASATDPKRLPLGLLVMPFAFHWFVTMAFYNFLVTIPVFCFATGLLLRYPEPSWRVITTFALLLLTATVSHPLGSLVIGLAALAAVRDWTSRLRVCIGGFPALLLMVSASGGLAAYHAEWPDSFKSPLFAIATAFYRFALPFGADEAATAIPAYVLLLFPAVVTALRYRKEPAPPAIRVAAVVLPLLFVLPEWVFNNYYIFHRIVPYLAVLVPAWANYDWLLARRKHYFALIGTLSLLATLQFYVGARTINAELEEYTAGISAIRGGQTLLPLNFDPKLDESRVVKPTLHAWGYYGVAKNLVSPYLFNSDPNVPRSLLVFRDYAPNPSAPAEHTPQMLSSPWHRRWVGLNYGFDMDWTRFEKQGYRSILLQACRYDYVLTWVEPQTFYGQLKRCFYPTFVKGRLVIYRNRALDKRASKS
ncbi:MAG: hypothetical protein IT371_20085 [Deltaproteobacteria bacterium]|nr:hypothetical protein [Deltaproteobacteria bacterium]